jgi:signal transduction histidine kinase
VRQIFRLALIFGALLVAIFVVHQAIRIQAAEYIITSPDPAASAAEWRRAGEGTRLLLQLFTAGALIMLLSSYLRVLQGHDHRPASSLEAMQPLTDALLDLKAREQAQRQEKRAAVAQMHEMRAIHATLLEGITTGVVTVDLQGRLATCNPSARAILNWSGPEPVGRPVGEVFRGCLPPGLESPGPTARRVEFTWRPPGLAPKHLGLSLSPIDTPQGRLTAMLFTDLTEMKRLKRQVEMRRHLAQLGEVSAGIAHEFRNNMGAVVGYARLIAKDLPDDAPAREVVEAMMGELTGMERLIRDLLDFSRKEEMQLAPVAVKPLLHHAAEVGGADFEVPVMVTVPSGLPALAADEGRLRQSLINLVRNACEAARSGPHAAVPEVSVSAAAESAAPGAPPEWVAVTVADNGAGVAPGSRAKIFLPFFTTKESGTGMGLAHVHKTVTAHGGDVTLIDSPDGGAAFRLRLPTVHHPAGTVPAQGEETV